MPPGEVLREWDEISREASTFLWMREATDLAGDAFGALAGPISRRSINCF
jgi:hypothetical protein